MRRHYRSRLCHGSGPALLALAALVAGPQVNAKPAPGPVVDTPLGFVQGTVSPTVGSAVQAFLGLRYADLAEWPAALGRRRNSPALRLKEQPHGRGDAADGLPADTGRVL